MLVYKTFYSIISFLTAVFLVGCFIEAVLKKKTVFYVVANIQVCAILTLFFFGFVTFSSNIKFAEYFYAIYINTQTLTSITILELVLYLETKQIKTVRQGIPRYILYCIVAADIIVMLVIPESYFTLIPVHFSDSVSTWQPYYKKLYMVHEILEYLISVDIIFRLVIDFVKTKGVTKRKYLIVLILYLFQVISYAIFDHSSKILQLNYSPVLCGILSIVAFYFSAYNIPAFLRNNMLQISNENLSDAVICFDNRNKCVYVNKAGRKVYNSENDEWVKKYLDLQDDYLRETENLLIQNELHTFDIEYKKIRDTKNIIAGSYIKLNDLTIELKEAEKEEYRATHDELTGFVNRAAFFAQCEQIIKDAPDEARYLIASNIKNFKYINDLFGTSFGDNLLKRQADMFRRAEYSDCVKGRISGDRFAMLISKKNFKPELAVKNTDFIKEMGQNISFPIVMQLGIYEVANPYEGVQVMYNKALLAIQNGPEAFSSKCVISYYDTSIMNKIVHEKNVIGEFKYSLQNGYFHMFLQSQIDSTTEKCLGAEALVRWFDKDSKCTYPSDFIEILEKSGLIYKLDSYIWEKAVQLLGDWKKRGIEQYISINISAKDFYYTDLYQEFTALVEKYGVSPDKLNLELTESAVIYKNSPHEAVLKKLHNYGFKIEMDDFGSGYSSLNVLKEIEMDVLKIDMEFLHETDNEERGRAIVASIIKMSKALGMTVVAEGVDSEEKKNFLKKNGCDIYQGYLFSKAVSVEDFEKKYLEVKA